MESQVERVLKSDALGRVELVRTSNGPFVRRVACGGGVWGSRLVARVLLERERRALAALEGVAGVAQLAERPGESSNGADRRGQLARSWIAGSALNEAMSLPLDFFDRLEELVHELHARGVCHNDLHKEQNVLIDQHGYPGLVDFQLASVHSSRGRTFRGRCREDLRHVEKLRRRYRERGDKSGPREPRARRSFLAWAWLKVAKPVYKLVMGMFSARDGELRRPSSGPWPDWTPEVGPRPATRAEE